MLASSSSPAPNISPARTTRKRPHHSLSLSILTSPSPASTSFVPGPSSPASPLTLSYLDMSPSSTSTSPILPPPPQKRPARNPKALSLALPGPSSSSTALKPQPSLPALNLSLPAPPPTRPPRRRHSAVTLLAHRPLNASPSVSDDDSEDYPYASGPIEVLPRIWLGSEENARDIAGLRARGIRWVLNVAKEVSLDTELRDSEMESSAAMDVDPPVANIIPPTPDPSVDDSDAVHHLHLPWSHGQTDLVASGFPRAMAFVDAALASNSGVLVHCQCGVSRSATLLIALVMRARLQGVQGMHDAYAYVKGKSRWVGPNMSLMYQLLEYERALASAPSTSTIPLTSDPQSSTSHLNRSADPPHTHIHTRSRTSSQSSVQSGITALTWDSSDSPLSSPASPPTPGSGSEIGSMGMGMEALEARLLDRQMEVRREAKSLLSHPPHPSHFTHAQPSVGLGIGLGKSAGRRRAVSDSTGLWGAAAVGMAVLSEVDEDEGMA